MKQAAIFITFVASLILASCAKEALVEQGNLTPTEEGSRVIAVSFAPQTKTSLANDGLQPKFVDNDSILISNGENIDTCKVSVVGKKATISTDLTGSLTAVYPYKAAGMNDINSKQIDTVLVSTVQSGTFADANICMAEMKDENGENLSFENKTAVFRITTGAGDDTRYVEVSAEGFNIANQFPEGSTYTSLDKIHVEVPATNKPDEYFVSILVPEGLTVGSLTFSDGTNEKTVTDEKAATAIAAGTLYTVTNENWKSPAADTPEPLKGVFTVSAGPDDTEGTDDDIKVRFSQGNLRYVVKTKKWGFYEHQYDFCHTKTYTGHHSDTVSLFTWGYNAEKSIIPDGQAIDNVSRTSGNLDQTEDWGSQIGDGKTWRTLTLSEWEYMLSKRNAATVGSTSNARYVTATVNGIAGMILLPDDYEHPSGLTDLSSINSSTVTFAGNIYDLTAWKAMESAGAVFLPATGVRGNNTNIISPGTWAFYWSSSAKDGSFAYRGVDFGSTNSVQYGSSYSSTRDSGLSVRLVTDVKVDLVPAYTSAWLGTISSVPAWGFDLTTWDGDDSKCAEIYVKAEMEGKICGNYTIENSGTFADESFTSTFGGKPIKSGTISITLLEPETINSRAYYEIRVTGITQDDKAFSYRYGSTITAYDANGYGISVIDDGYVPEPVCFEIPERESIMEAVLVQNQIGVTIRVTGGNPAMTTAPCETKTVTIGGKQYSFSRKLNTNGEYNLSAINWRKISVYAPAKGTMYVITDDELGVISGTTDNNTNTNTNTITTNKGDGYVSFFADFVEGHNEYTLKFASSVSIYGFVFVPANAN